MTIGFLASVPTSAAASASGVRENPAMMSALSRTTSSWARRLATSGAVPPVPGILADQLDLLAGDRVAVLFM
jgi:hypothetical protein